MKTITLDVWERMQLLQCVPPTSPNLLEVRKHLRVADLMELTSEERKEVGFLMTSENQIAWKLNKEFEISFEDADYNHLKELVDLRENWPTVRNTEKLLEKFEED